MSKSNLRVVDTEHPHARDLARQRVAEFRLDREKGEKPLPVVNVTDTGAPLLRPDEVLNYDDHQRRLGRKA